MFYNLYGFDSDEDDEDFDSDSGMYFGAAPAQLPIVVRENVAESSLDPEFNIKKRIVDVLSASSASGDYCTGGKLSNDYLMPAIEILQETNGQYKALPLPIVYEEQAKDLIKNCSKSPFGRGEATVYDDNVRKSWQLDPQKFRITNPRWNGLIGELVGNIKRELGIAVEKRITFSLYKMLLYEEGGFFDFHRDTEKEDGMIATMVIQLPSSFTGGEIIVRHNEREKKFECDKEAAYCPYYVSFYCDCSHKVERVTSGYRLALIYNLKYSGADKIAVVDSSNQVAELQRTINSWVKAPMYSQLCYILEHKYSIAGLNPTLLKGKDEIAYKLFKQLDSVVTRIAILEKHETSHGTTIHDIEETTLEYKAQLIMDNNATTMITVVEDEIFPADARRSMTETSKDVETTGNEGATIERLYKSACIIVYPKQLEESQRGNSTAHIQRSLLQGYKNNPSEKNRCLLMTNVSSCLVCSEDSKCESMYGLDINTLLEACVTLNYLPLSVKFLERLWVGQGLRSTQNVQVALQIINQHGAENFKILFEKSINKCYEAEGAGTLVLELKETAWLDIFINKLLRSSSIFNSIGSKAIMVLLSIKQQFPSFTEKIEKIVNMFVQAQLTKPSYYYSRESISGEVVAKLNIFELCPKVFNDFEGYKLTLAQAEQVLILMKHFGIERVSSFLNNALSKVTSSDISRLTDIFEKLAMKDGVEEKFLASKLLETIFQKFGNNSDLSSTIRLLTFSRKHGKIAQEIDIAKTLIANTNYSTPSRMHNLMQGIIKENGSECFWTGSGFRLLLDHCYKLFYDAAHSNKALDMSFGDSNWVFTHINIPCTCPHCERVKIFLGSNLIEYSMKEKLEARKHVEKALRGALDIQTETIKKGSPQTLKLTKVRKTAEAKKSAMHSIGTILKQYSQCATLSDQKVNARPAEASSSTEPQTKKVKQEETQ